MDTPEQVFDKIERLVKAHPQFKIEAYSFILAALHYTMQSVSPPRHITGREFCQGIRAYAIDQFGPMSRTVLAHWGINQTLDFGKLVFALIDVGLMRKTEEDQLDDFKDVYQFDEAFTDKLTFDHES